MIWIIGFIVIVVLVVAISSSGSEIANAQASAEQETRLVSRVAAYRDYIRREGGKPEWQKMSDNELEDAIADAIRQISDEIGNIRRLKTITFWLLFPTISISSPFLLSGIGIISAGSNTFNTFASSFVGALITGFLISKLAGSWYAKSVDEKWEAQGWDVDKLIV